MSDTTTPRTDAAEHGSGRGGLGGHCDASFARELETELTAANARIAELEKEAKASRTDAFLDSELTAQLNLETDFFTRQLSESEEKLKLALHDAAQESLKVVKLQSQLSESQAKLAKAKETISEYEIEEACKRGAGGDYAALCESQKRELRLLERASNLENLETQLTRANLDAATDAATIAELRAHLASAKEEADHYRLSFNGAIKQRNEVRAQLASEISISDALAEQLHENKPALAALVVERDRARKDADSNAANGMKAIEALERLTKENSELLAQLASAREQLDYQNIPNKREPVRGGYEFYINEEWTGIRDAAIGENPGFSATLMKCRYDPDDERVRVRRILDDDAILAELASAREDSARLWATAKILEDVFSMSFYHGNESSVLLEAIRSAIDKARGVTCPPAVANHTQLPKVPSTGRPITQEEIDGDSPVVAETGEKDAWPPMIPIETAPKDGTNIMLYSEQQGFHQGFWSPMWDRWLSLNDGRDVYGTMHNPIAWATLPPPPQGKEKGQ